MTTESVVQRKLTTILAADAEGYSRAMDVDEVDGIQALREARAVFFRLIGQQGGRVANTAGDANGRLRFRIGVHLGDVIVEGEDLLGEGVNLAARLQENAEPGGILISRQVYDQVQHKLPVSFEHLGNQRLKNFIRDVDVYRARLNGPQGDVAFETVEMPEAEAAEWPPDSSREAERERRRQDRAARKMARRDASAKADVSTMEGLEKRLVRHGRLMGVLAALLVGVDVATGEPVWSQWPILGLAGLLAMEAAPLAGRFGLDRHAARAAIAAVILVLINLFSWAGYPWALWPIGGILAAELIRRLVLGSR